MGAGNGAQSFALKELGFKVFAVGFSEELLAELASHNSEIEIVNSDIRDLDFVASLNSNVIVCMGDTITHLESLDEVMQLLKLIYGALSNNEKIIMSFRDLSVQKNDIERFIPVRNDSDRILTCFLEDALDKVKVFDLLYERNANGSWSFKNSFYYKLKINFEWLAQQALLIGFKSIHVETLPSGLSVLIAQKDLKK